MGLWFSEVRVARRAVVSREEDGVMERGVCVVRRDFRVGKVVARGSRDCGVGRRVRERSRAEIVLKGAGVVGVGMMGL